MSRRKFIFRSLQSALLFSPVFELRNLAAQTSKKVIPFFFVDGGSPYPRATDFFPSPGSGGNFNLPGVLRGFENLKSDMVILDGVNISRRSGTIVGNWHVTTVGRVLTAKTPYAITVGDNDKATDGLPGGPSVDQIIASQLKVRSAEVLVNHRTYNYMRARPFAVGSKQFKLPIYNISTLWDQLFKDCQPTYLQTDKAKEERIKRLKAKTSIMDSLLEDLARVRKELSGVEKIKLDSHETAIREAERAVAGDLKREEDTKEDTVSRFDCKKPSNMDSSFIPQKSQAHFDVLYAAIKTERIGVAGMMHGYSSVQWMFEWLNLNPKIKGNSHDGVYHVAGSQRSHFLKMSHWKWTELAKFAEKLKNEPGGSLLDKVLIYATSHFGLHHNPDRIPVIFIGNAQGKLKTGRVIKVKTDNDKPLTSMAHLCGVNIKGIGDDPNCGPLDLLHT